MPLTPTAAKGTTSIMVEGAVGEVTLLATVTAIATNTGITAPTGSTGMRFHVIFTNWFASGSFTITGTGTPGNTETVNIPAPTAQQLQSPQIANFEYVSVNAYTAITNVTCTGGMIGAQLTIKGVQAAKFNVPSTAFKSNNPMPRYSPNEHSGLMSRDKKLIAQENKAAIDTFDSDWYGDLSLYWVYLMLGSPTWSTLPAAPLSVVASATIVASMTVANQPTAPGMKLIVLASTFAASASLTVTGTSYGLTVNETITITGNGTFYSANVYSAITTIGGTTNATTVVITGVFGWKGVVTSEGTRSSVAVEHFDGSGSWTHPSFCASDGDFTVNPSAEGKLTLKGICQDKLPIGDRTTNPLNVSRVAALGIPLSDLPAAGWQTQVYVDPIIATAQTTIYTDPEADIKIILKTPSEAHWTYNNQQEWTRVYPGKPECTVSLNTDIINLLQYEQERQNLKQYLVVALVGEPIGTTGGVFYTKSWTWTLPVRYELYGQEGDPSKANTYAKPTLRCEYDPAIGGAYSLTVVTRNPPNYTA
jgi:hypothetical protein